MKHKAIVVAREIMIGTAIAVAMQNGIYWWLLRKSNRGVR
jgi:hypothetical protein